MAELCRDPMIHLALVWMEDRSYCPRARLQSVFAVAVMYEALVPFELASRAVSPQSSSMCAATRGSEHRFGGGPPGS